MLRIITGEVVRRDQEKWKASKEQSIETIYKNLRNSCMRLKKVISSHEIKKSLSPFYYKNIFDKK